jgi:Fe-S cluster biogenesis protein NfuA
MIAMHAETITDEQSVVCPDVLRWVIPAGTLCCTGDIARAPGTLGALMKGGTLARISVEGSTVMTWLGAGHSWRDDGATVRTALHGALESPEDWEAVAPASALTRDQGPDAALDGRADDGRADGRRADGRRADDELSEVARSVLSGRVGDIIRSHGGEAELVSVSDGVVAVRLRGACSGCPAAGFTLHARLERELRERYPGLVRVVEV